MSNELPLSQVPSPPEDYTAGAVLSRLMDSLGFRYYWATEGLTDGDLAYRPSETGRTVFETLEHIHDIVTMIESAYTGDAFELPPQPTGMTADELRQATLERIQRVSERAKAGTDDMAALSGRFIMGGSEQAFPFWNTIGGVMVDAIYHVGQVVAFRRATGNPIDDGVNVYLGRRFEPKA